MLSKTIIGVLIYYYIKYIWPTLELMQHKSVTILNWTLNYLLFTQA